MLNRKFPDNNDNVVDIVPEKKHQGGESQIFLTISQERSDPLLTDEHVQVSPVAHILILSMQSKQNDWESLQEES